MVDIAQLVEHLIVVQKVARSSRVIHPTENPPMRRVFRLSACLVCRHDKRVVVRGGSNIDTCVCQWCALCDRSTRWDIPDLDWIARSNADCERDTGHRAGGLWLLMTIHGRGRGLQCGGFTKRKKPLNRRIQVAYY